MKHRITQAECAENPAHGLRVKLEFFLNVLAGNSEIQSIDIGQTGHDRQQCNDMPAHPRGNQVRLLRFCARDDWRDVVHAIEFLNKDKSRRRQAETPLSFSSLLSSLRSGKTPRVRWYLPPLFVP